MDPPKDMADLPNGRQFDRAASQPSLDNAEDPRLKYYRVVSDGDAQSPKRLSARRKSSKINTPTESALEKVAKAEKRKTLKLEKTKTEISSSTKVNFTDNSSNKAADSSQDKDSEGGKKKTATRHKKKTSGDTDSRLPKKESEDNDKYKDKEKKKRRATEKVPRKKLEDGSGPLAVPAMMARPASSEEIKPATPPKPGFEKEAILVTLKGKRPLPRSPTDFVGTAQRARTYNSLRPTAIGGSAKGTPSRRRSATRPYKRSRSLPSLASWDLRIRGLNGGLDTSLPTSTLLTTNVVIPTPVVSEDKSKQPAVMPRSTSPVETIIVRVDNSEKSTPAPRRKREVMISAFDWLKTLDLSTLSAPQDDESSSDHEQGLDTDRSYFEDTLSLIDDNPLEDSDELDSSTESISKVGRTLMIPSRSPASPKPRPKAGTHSKKGPKSPTKKKKKPVAVITAAEPAKGPLASLPEESVASSDDSESQSEASAPSTPKHANPRERYKSLRREEFARSRKNASSALPDLSGGTEVVRVRRPSLTQHQKQPSALSGEVHEEQGLVYSLLTVGSTPEPPSPRSANTKVVISGTLDAIVAHALAMGNDSKFGQEFLLSLPWFSASAAVLDTMTNVKGAETAKVVGLVQKWIETHFRYFRIEEAARNKLMSVLEALKGSAHDRKPGTHDLLKRIVSYKLGGIDPRDLLSLAISMKSTNGIKMQTAPGIRPTFEGDDAIRWLREARGLTEEDAFETCTQLLKDGYIVSNKSPHEDDAQFKPTSKYIISITKEAEMYKTLELATPSATPKQTSRFSTFHPQTFAKQLAYFEYNMFKRIEAHEYHYWIKGEKDKRAQMAPNLYQVVNFVNQVSLWVATEIVTAANPKLRQTLLKKFVLVAQYCLKYKNYQGLLEIMGGLNSTAVRRLATWDEVSSKYSDMVDKLAEIVSPTQNWKNYRPLIENERPPCVPYVGLFLADLTFLTDGNPTKLENGHINWKKMTKLASVLQKAQKCSKGVYDIVPQPDIIRFLSEELYALNEKELFARSRVVEPGRLRSNSGF